jgi:hypothetical protein
MDGHVQGVEEMSKGGGGSTSTYQPDPEFKQAALQNYAFAQQVAQQPYQAYGGPRIAGFTQPQQEAMAAIRQSPLSLGESMQQFYNPYNEQVIGNTLQNIENQRLMQQQQTRAQAAKAGAYGGTRQAVQEALQQQAALQTGAQAAAQLAQQGFGQAAALGAQDIGLRQQAAAGLQASGAQQQALNQANLDLAYQDFMRQQNYPLQQLQILQQGLTQMPSGGTQQTTQNLSGAQQFGQGLSNVAALAYLFSDKRMKENISKMKSPLAALGGMNGYEYEYKGSDMPTGGVMAQEVERVMPNAVAYGGNGMKMVNYPEVTGLLVEAVKELDRRTRG